MIRAASILVLLSVVLPGPQEDEFEKKIRPLFQKFCFDCHSADSDELDLTAFPKASRRVWKEVWNKLHTQEMPPKEEKQPTQDERERMAGWIEKKLSKLDYKGPKNPGRVTMRRLNRVEYNNTMRDLFGVDFGLTKYFPTDDLGYGFDTVGDVLSIPPLLMEKYLAASERALHRVVLTPESRKPTVRRFEAKNLQESRGTSRSGNQRVLYSEGELFQNVNVKEAGEYRIRVSAEADQAGPEPARMAIRVDGQNHKFIEVKNVRGKPKSYEARITIQAGRRRIGAAFINDYWNPKHPDPKKRDRNLILNFIEMLGPYRKISEEEQALHNGIFIDKDPRKIVAAFARRAFRRPVKKEEVDRYAKLLEKAEGSFEEKMKLPLQGILVSPNFLLRPESGKLDGFELATRLSYFLWSSMPDEELLARAEKGDLLKADVLRKQIRRMIRDPRSTALAENFATQWLQVRRLGRVAPDPEQFPTFNEKLREAMRREVVLFFEAVMREDRSVLELFDSNFTFVNEPLARHYRIWGVRGDEMRRVRLPDDKRGGVMTMAAVLTVTSNATRTSAVKRGKWVLDAMLGTPPPPPLPDAGILDESPSREEQGLSLRQRLEKHRKDPKCLPCHARMDPIGFGFENFDAIGRWRETEDGRALDTRATLPDGQSFSGPVELKKILMKGKDRLIRNLIEKMMIYSLGRGLEPYDGPTIRGVADSLGKNGHRFSVLIEGIAMSFPFLNRRGKDD